MLEDPKLREKVYSNLNNALENGYDFTNNDVKFVADDLLSYADYDFEEYPGIEPEQLFKYIKEWQIMRKK